MTAVGYPMEITEVADPLPPANGVVLGIEATGICRSDWHAWMGHEGVDLPHVPGHEMAGVVIEAGPEVERFGPGDRVTVPFSMGCGRCRSCREGHLNTCDESFTPGFTHWGSFAERTAIPHADLNLIRLPDRMGSVEAAALGCRFVTAFRAVADQAKLQEGPWLAVYGCGGVGLSAVMIAKALGGRVIAIDITPDKLALAAELGAEVTIEVGGVTDPAAEVMEATDGGAHASIDALGSTSTALNSIRSLRKHGRHIQVGLMHGPDAAPSIPMEQLIMRELELVGSRGLPATAYPRVFSLIASEAIDPARLVTRTVPLEDAFEVLEAMGSFAGVGVTVIDRF
jgi:alcohol dehydrogenase